MKVNQINNFIAILQYKKPLFLVRSFNINSKHHISCSVTVRTLGSTSVVLAIFVVIHSKTKMWIQTCCLWNNQCSAEMSYSKSVHIKCLWNVCHENIDVIRFGKIIDITSNSFKQLIKIYSRILQVDEGAMLEDLEKGKMKFQCSN